MKTYTSEEIKKIAVRHLAWLRKEAGGERADLSNANFSYANFGNANFSYADFRNADLSNANFSYANFGNANFSYADFRYADFSDADFGNANFSYAVGNGKEIVSYTSRWTVVMSSGKIRIGCQCHEAKSWLNFTDERIAEMHTDAIVWWAVHKPIVIGMYEAHFGKIEEASNA